MAIRRRYRHDDMRMGKPLHKPAPVRCEQLYQWWLAPASSLPAKCAARTADAAQRALGKIAMSAIVRAGDVFAKPRPDIRTATTGLAGSPALEEQPDIRLWYRIADN